LSDNGDEILEQLFEEQAMETISEAMRKVATPTQPEDKDEAKSDVETHVQWAFAGNGRFSPVGATTPKIPAGIYECFATPGAWGLERLDISSDGIYHLPDMATDTVLAEVNKFWGSEDKYRKYGLLYKRGVILWGSPGCLDKDTRISYVSRDPDGKRRSGKGGSIERLFQVFHGLTGRGKGRYQVAPKDSTFWVSSVDDNGRIFKNRVLDVVNSGFKECFKVTTKSGLTITATADHKFFTEDGFKALSELGPGSPLFIHNNTAIKEVADGRTVGTRHDLYVNHHPVAGTKIINKKYRYKKLSRSRAAVEAAMNKLSLSEYVERLNTGDLSNLKFLERDENVHHLDENCSNDVLENLVVINQREHSRLHAFEMPVKYIAVPDVIKSIRPVGKRATYDIKVFGPNNNFVADGFVVHNSGKTITCKLLMNELVRRDGVVIVAQSIRLTIMCMKAIRRIEPKRNLIVLLEDIDEIINHNGESEVLSMLDGENNVDNILHLATTNHPERLGARIINRPSRFDRRVYVGLPEVPARTAYLRKSTNDGLDEATLTKWVTDTQDMSIAHLRELVAAVYCLEQPYDDVIERLKKMAEQVKSEDEFKKRSMGFKSKERIPVGSGTLSAG
jgi:hypothetical protein